MKIIYTLETLTHTAIQIIKSVNTKNLLFEAEMGIGKTTLIKEICKQLGVKDTVTSPTYALVNEYKTKKDLIYHFDFYRIKNENEAYQIGFEEYLEKDAWIFIEWPNKIKNLIPVDHQKIQITLGNDGKRIAHLL